jgi:short subunit dehydrogenase-like uncharacterized protein
MSAADRDLDLVLQGSTGFTGRLAAAELAARAPDGLRWGVAGRDAARVEALAAEHGVAGVVADGLDEAAVDALAARARVVLSCAGPFSRYGTPLVEACVRRGTHYADLTGEMPWMRRLIDRFHEPCAAAGTTLVPASGYDSVPTDAAVHAFAAGGRAGAVTGFVRMRGGLNGGTLASGIELFEQWAPADFAHPHLLDPDPAAGLAASPAAPRRGRVFSAGALGGWGAPFIMAPVNERVVRRSAALLRGTAEAYGPGFRYDEHLLTNGRLGAHGMSALLGITNGLLARRGGRGLLRRLGPKPGQGPSAQSIESGFAQLTLVDGALDEPDRIRRWSWNGDPSNRITVRCLVQTGLALAAGEARRGGVLTPAAAFGGALLRRLTASGAVREEELAL